MQLHSPAFANNESIPVLFTGDGDNISPPLQWGGAPDGVVSYALIVEDPDAPSGVFTHWLIWNIPAIMTGLDREVPEGSHYGAQALQGMNDFGKIGYGGPKPPSGEHRYFFRIYALDSILELPAGASKDDLLDAMKGRILSQGELMGRYAVHDPLLAEHELKQAREAEDAYDRAAHYNIMNEEKI